MAKGGSYERDFCRRLSLWYTDFEADDLFWRTSNSGGRATVRGRKGKRTEGQSGDIQAVDGRGRPLTERFTIELKRGYNRVTPIDLLDGRGTVPAAQRVYGQWLKQAEEAADRNRTPYWMLVHRRDGRAALCAFPKCVVADLRAFGFKMPQGPAATVWAPGCRCLIVIMPMERFFQEVHAVHVSKLPKIVT
jgi:hypothetical protein